MSTYTELVNRQREAFQAEQEARARSGSRLTPEFTFACNNTLAASVAVLTHERDEARKQGAADAAELDVLRTAVRAGQDEIARLAELVKDREAARDMYREKFDRCGRAIDCANRIRDQYYRALVAATRDKAEPPPPTPQELAKTFGVEEPRRETYTPRAGKPRIVSPDLVLHWAAKYKE